MTEETSALPSNRAQRDTARRQQKREKDRLRIARKRERQQEAARLAAIVEAERLEAETRRRERLDDRLAPAVLRHPVMTTGTAARGVVRYAGVAEEGAPMIYVETTPATPARMLVGARVRIVDGKPVRAFCVTDENDPIVKLARETKAITERHAEAARQLQFDWEDVGGGMGPGAVDYLRTGGGGGGGGLNEAMLAQVETRARLDGALAHLGAFAPSVARIVLDCVPVYVWAEQIGKTRLEAVAWLALALDRLVSFYWWPDTLPRVRILTLAPPRSAYEIGIGNVDATDA